MLCTLLSKQSWTKFVKCWKCKNTLYKSALIKKYGSSSSCIRKIRKISICNALYKESFSFLSEKMCDCLEVVCVVECINIRLVLSALCTVYIYVNYVRIYMSYRNATLLGPAVIIKLTRKQAGGIQEEGIGEGGFERIVFCFSLT